MAQEIGKPSRDALDHHFGQALDVGGRGMAKLRAQHAGQAGSRLAFAYAEAIKDIVHRAISDACELATKFPERDRKPAIELIKGKSADLLARVAPQGRKDEAFADGAGHNALLKGELKKIEDGISGEVNRKGYLTGLLDTRPFWQRNQVLSFFVKHGWSAVTFLAGIAATKIFDHVWPDK